MIRRPPRSTRTDTLFPYTTLFRSHRACARLRRGLEQARDAPLPDGPARGVDLRLPADAEARAPPFRRPLRARHDLPAADRKSTRLNSSPLMRISYAVFCLKKNTQSTNHCIKSDQHTTQN